TDYLSRTLGQQFIIENVAGAGGTTGSTRTMRATPDGYTIQVGQMGTHAAAVAFYPNLAYKPDVDFDPIGMIAGLPIVLTARKDFPPGDLKEFIAYVKANAATVNVAHAGVGSITHTTVLLLHALLGVKPTLVPFNGAAPAMNALIGSQVDYISNAIPDAVQPIVSGRPRAMPSAPPSAARACRISRPRRKPACPRSTHRPGTPCSRPRGRRRRCSTGSATPSTRRSTTMACASACSISAATSRPSPSAGRNSLARWSPARSRAGRRSSRRHRHDAGAPPVSARRGKRGAAPRGRASGAGANLSGAAGALHRRLSGRQRARHHRAPGG